MSAEHRTTPPRKCIAAIEVYGRRKFDAVLLYGDRVIERTAFRTRREAENFLRQIDRAGITYMPDAGGGAPVDEVPFEMEPNGPIGFNGDYLWADGGPIESIDLDLGSIDPDSIPF